MPVNPTFPNTSPPCERLKKSVLPLPLDAAPYAVISPTETKLPSDKILLRTAPLYFICNSVPDDSKDHPDANL